MTRVSDLSDMICGMHGGSETGAGARAWAALRWLGAPPTVLALIVLVLNDHVWKQQWPGFVTGKVSDVAGLLVAPALLALALAPVPRVLRPDRLAVATVAVAFTLVKATTVGAAAASAAWSVLTPSQVRADVTDLLALPILVVAARTARWAREPSPGPRRRAALAAGALVLPGAVLGTAATSACQGHAQAHSVTAVTGRLATTPAGWNEDFIIRADAGDLVLQHDTLVRPAPADTRRLGEVEDTYANPFGERLRLDCSRAEPARCWRLPTQGRVLVEASTDGGTTWARDYSPSKRYREDVVDDLGEKCDEPAPFDVSDLAVADTPHGPVVVVALRSAGVALRSPAGSWARIPLTNSWSAPAATPVVTTSPLPSHPGQDRSEPPLVPLDPVTLRTTRLRTTPLGTSRLPTGQ